MWEFRQCSLIQCTGPIHISSQCIDCPLGGANSQLNVWIAPNILTASRYAWVQNLPKGKASYAYLEHVESSYLKFIYLIQKYWTWSSWAIFITQVEKRLRKPIVMIPSELSHFLIWLLTHLLNLHPKLITFMDYHMMHRFSVKNQDQDTACPDPIFADLFWLW